jgi:hypothetical protein
MRFIVSVIAFATFAFAHGTENAHGGKPSSSDLEGWKTGKTGHHEASGNHKPAGNRHARNANRKHHQGKRNQRKDHKGGQNRHGAPSVPPPFEKYDLDALSLKAHLAVAEYEKAILEAKKAFYGEE